ncbi:MAG: FAD-dependent oxidoreductase [Gemmatimonadota bacterium]
MNGAEAGVATGCRDRAKFAYRRAPDQDAATPVRCPVVIVGGGMVGLTLALELLDQGIRPVVVERNDTVSEGSRAICQSQRSLEIWDRLGAGDRVRARGVTWNTGKVFLRDTLLYEFGLLSKGTHKMPAFVNLQQYLVEEILIDRLLAQGGDIRWRHACTEVDGRDDHVSIRVTTPEGDYRLESEWLVACDGAGSGVRKQLGLAPEGEVFPDKFLIADVRMKASLPAERRFWFEPSFHSGQTALLHRQADDVWRIDLQLDRHADVQTERDPERVTERIRRMLGPGVEFTLEWVSIYVFQCRTLDRYVHGRIIFAGDSAHQVSPFGARGGNAGVQDANNLAWKLARVIRGSAGPGLLPSYEAERIVAAREDILHSTRATSFMTPRTRATRAMRDAALRLAGNDPAYRPLINSGRLSVPAHFRHSPLSTADRGSFDAALGPGSPAVDAPLEADSGSGWLLNRLAARFTLLVAGDGPPGSADRPSVAGEEVDVVRVGGAALRDGQGVAALRYDLEPGTCYLFRPDRHIAARSRDFDVQWLERAVQTALGYA